MFLNKIKTNNNVINNQSIITNINNSEKKINNLVSTNIPSIIASDLSILGNLISEGAIEIEGSVEGNISCHFVCVRKQGFVKGDIVADEVTVDGEVRGLVKAKVVKLSNSAKVIGIIMYESLAIDAGAFVDGQFKSVEKISFNEDFAELKNKNLNITEKSLKDKKLEAVD